MPSRSALVRLGLGGLGALGLLALSATAACTQPSTTDADGAARLAHVTHVLADLAGDDAAAARAAAGLAALGPADAATIPVLMAALACPVEAADTGAHATAAEPAHGDHVPGEHVHGGGGNDHIVLAAASGLGAIGNAAVAPRRRTHSRASAGRLW